MPPRPKKAAHERNTANHSHSLGLAAPGRPIPRHKSSLPDVNGSPSATSTALANGRRHSPSLTSAFDPQDQIATDPSDINGSLADNQNMGSSQSQPLPCKHRSSSGASDNDIEAHGADASLTYRPALPLSIDVKSATQASKPATHSKSRLASATTILSSCPLWDVIAILIILLQLPPTVISIVHGLFAFMTFVPPSSSLSLGSLPSFHEMISVDPVGAPSVQTILLVDVLLMAVFVWLTIPAQNIILDLAQVVIATSLGGAAVSQGYTPRSLFCCLAIIFCSHLFRWRTARVLGLRLVTSTLKLKLPPEASDSIPSPIADRLYTFPGKARSVLGAHILAQGILKGVRRYITWSKSQVDTQANAKKNDDALFSGSNASTPRTSLPPTDPNSDSSFAGMGDGRPPGPSPAGNLRDKTNPGKKKNKKQATQVRIQQPFWAALASTKVTVAKEYEHSWAPLDARESQAVDVTNLGDVNMTDSRNRVWIMEVGATDICFCISLLFLNQSESEQEEGGSEVDTRRWHVRVNGASWHSVKSKSLEKRAVGDEVWEKWEARIYGLTPLAPYRCEFVMDEEETVIYDTSLITQPAPSTETAAIISTPTQTLQPSSPATTLRNSIQAADNEADKVRNNVKSMRKQHRGTLERLQSTMDREKSRLMNTGGTDDRQRQRGKQLENSILKIRSEREESQHELDDLGDIPSADRNGHSNAKTAAKTLQKNAENRKSAFQKSKKEADKVVASAKNEMDSVMHKRNRFEGRQKEYAAKLIDASKQKEQTSQAKSARQNRQLESAARRREAQTQWEIMLTQMDNMLAEEQANYKELHSTIVEYDEWAKNAQATGSLPSTPEMASLLPSAPSGIGSNSLPGSRPSSLHVSANPFSPSFAVPQLSSHANMSSGSGALGGLSSLSRRRASSLEASNGSDGVSGGVNSSYHTPFSTSGLQPPPGFGSFSPASSAALLANSTALAPSPSANTFTFPSLGNGFGQGQHSPIGAIKHTPTPVGAEKMEGRRKGSGGSGHSVRGGGGSENGSPRLGNGVVGNGVVNGIRNGMVSPPGSIWESDGR